MNPPPPWRRRGAWGGCCLRSGRLLSFSSFRASGIHKRKPPFREASSDFLRLLSYCLHRHSGKPPVRTYRAHDKHGCCHYSHGRYTNVHCYVAEPENAIVEAVLRAVNPPSQESCRPPAVPSRAYRRLPSRVRRCRPCDSPPEESQSLHAQLLRPRSRVGGSSGAAWLR